MARAFLQDIADRTETLKSGLEVDSAGISPVFLRATPEAIEVSGHYGLDLTRHESKALDANLVKWADLILVMETWHTQQIVSRYPEATGKTWVMSDYLGEKGEIPDPYGGGLHSYLQCANRLHSLVRKLADALEE